MTKANYILFIVSAILCVSCGTKKKLQQLTYEHDQQTNTLRATTHALSECNQDKELLISQLDSEKSKRTSSVGSKDEMISELKTQIEDLKKQRDQQSTQVSELTVLTQSANENINQTIKQLEGKDKYISHLMNVKSKADSLNLVLAVNLKQVLREGINDSDIDVRVDKTVVMINLSDKMLFQSGSHRLSPAANSVLGKIAAIAKSKPNLEVMVEGYTDNVPMRNSCIEDNWDLSVKRATSVIRSLQKNHGINPNKLIAAGRGEYNTLADNSTSEGKSINRRTRIILMPELNQFYDLLDPSEMNIQN